MNPPDDVNDLARTVAAEGPAPVDELHIAAYLESSGVTDIVARERYGYADVFALARDLLPLLQHDPDDPDEEPERIPRPRLPILLAHGLFYALPVPVFPAVFLVLGPAGMARGLIFATAFGWVWGMGTAAAAYRVYGLKRIRAAARLQLALSGAGLVVGAAGALLLITVLGGEFRVVAFATAQIGFQLAAGVLVFYRRELTMLALMLPAVVAGSAHMISGLQRTWTPWVLLAGVVSVLLVLTAATLIAGRRAVRPDFEPLEIPRGVLTPSLAAVGFAVVSATFLLYTDARYLTASFDLSIAVAPLLVAMGTLEYCAYRFADRGADLVRAVRVPADFRGRIWRVLLRELAVCSSVLAAAGFGLVVALNAAGVLSTPGALLIFGHLLLGAAYFVGFVLANLQRFGRLLSVSAAVVTCYIAASLVVAPTWAPHGEIPVFLIGSTVLLLGLLVALRSSIGHVHHYR